MISESTYNDNQDNVKEKNQLNNKILFICDFTGKIVFCKGDPKVFGMNSNQYLHFNFFNFKFTIRSRLELRSKLDAKIYQPGHTQTMTLQLVKQNKFFKPETSKRRHVRLSLPKLNEYMQENIKLLKTSVSQVDKIQSSCVDIYLLSDKENHSMNEKFYQAQRHSRLDKLLLFEIQETNHQIQQLFSKKIQEQKKLSIYDIQFVKKTPLERYLHIKNPYEDTYHRHNQYNSQNMFNSFNNFTNQPYQPLQFYTHGLKTPYSFKKQSDLFDSISMQQQKQKQNWPKVKYENVDKIQVLSTPRNKRAGYKETKRSSEKKEKTQKKGRKSNSRMIDENEQI